MPIVLLILLRWVLSKALGILIAGAIAVGAFALYLYIDDSWQFEQERVERLDSLKLDKQQLLSRLDDLHGNLIELGKEVESSRTKLAAANAALETLEAFIAKVEYFFLTPAEKRAYDEKLAKARRDKQALADRLASVTGEQAALRLTRGGLLESAQKLESEIQALETASSSVGRYVNDAYRDLRPYLPYALAGILFAPLAYKLALFYVIGPLLASFKPVRFSPTALPRLISGAGGVSVALELAGAQRAWIKESFLQASDESLARSTRFVLNWQIPFTCAAAGLMEMVEFRAEKGSSGSITVSTQDKGEIELKLVEIPEGGSLILRPSHVAGLASLDGSKIRIRRRWSFFRAQSWITLQFRYFIFEGPCKLLISGARGVREERLEGGAAAKGRRANQDSVIGFTPDLAYGAVRAETFWTYLRGANPLFDDVFRGEGTFLCQEISKPGEAAAPARFWAGLRDTVLKIVGL